MSLIPLGVFTLRICGGKGKEPSMREAQSESPEKVLGIFEPIAVRLCFDSCWSHVRRSFAKCQANSADVK
jgi:hypothetical protein